jgi:hypothetical protein
MSDGHKEALGQRIEQAKDKNRVFEAFTSLLADVSCDKILTSGGF